jgi:hypothetical protein
MFEVLFLLVCYLIVGAIVALGYNLLTCGNGPEIFSVILMSPIMLTGFWALWAEKHRIWFCLALTIALLPIASYWLLVFFGASDELGILAQIHRFQSFPVPVLSLIFLLIHCFHVECYGGYRSETCQEYQKLID